MAKLLLLLATVFLVCAASGNAQEADACAEIDVDYQGSDVKLDLKVPSWRDCSKLCKSSDDCEAFTFVTKSKCCYHKKAAAADNKQSKTGVISGDQDCPAPLKITVSPDYPTKTVPGGLCYFPKKYRMTKSNFVGTVPKMAKSFEISFEVFPITFQAGWTSVVHFTTGGNIGPYGTRTPAVFLNQNAMYTSNAVSGNGNFFFTVPGLALKKWMSVKIVQQVENGVYTFSMFSNGNMIKKVTNTQPRAFSNLKLYVGDPWYATANAYIRNLCLSTQ